MTKATQWFLIRISLAVGLVWGLAAGTWPGPFAAAEQATPSMPAVGLPMAAPDEVGMSADGLARITPAMQTYVDDGRLAGIVTLVARRGKVVHWEAVGQRDLEAGDPLERNDIFRIYSMTKPITSSAVMMLVDEGRLALTDSVADYIPAFADVDVLAADGTRVPARAPMTVEHLLTHTSGLTYGFFGDSPVDRLYRESGVMAAAADLEDFANRVAGLPLLAHPGDRWNYSVSTDILGRVVEVASGQDFASFVHTRILEPLGMTDTAFVVPAEKRDRFTASYTRRDETLVQVDSPRDGTYTRDPAWPSGGGGLTSTAADYIRFAQMLLDGGRFGDRRLLAPTTVESMRSNHLPDRLVPIQLGSYLSPGYGFGLGFAVMTDAARSPEPDHDGVFRWAGAANTFFWIDPEAELIGMVWTQMAPFALYDLEREFQTLVYDAVQH